jgi:hypothetical protein
VYSTFLALPSECRSVRSPLLGGGIFLRTTSYLLHHEARNTKTMSLSSLPLALMFTVVVGMFLPHTAVVPAKVESHAYLLN